MADAGLDRLALALDLKKRIITATSGPGSADLAECGEGMMTFERDSRFESETDPPRNLNIESHMYMYM